MTFCQVAMMSSSEEEEEMNTDEYYAGFEDAAKCGSQQNSAILLTNWIKR